jgi:hypothetical protein
VVQFYGADEELVEAAGEYLARAIADASVAVVVATAAHLQAFEARLASAGVDVAAARHCGALVSIDAETAVRQFVAAGQIDQARFESQITQEVRDAAAAGHPVRVYGEMVGVLWDAGHLTAALELETLWDELGRDVPLSLYCAYRDPLAAGGPDPVAQVRRLHAAVVRTRDTTAPAALPPLGLQAACTFAGSRVTPRAARHFATATLAEWHRQELASDAGLIVAELANNAVTHARSGFTVSISTFDHAVRISVGDTMPLAGAQPDQPLPVIPGHGLSVVAALAASWGVQELAGGKAVWAELRSP